MVRWRIGQRALVQSYAVLTLPWGAALAWLLQPERRPALRVAAVVAAVLLVDLNLFQHWQYMRSIIHPEEMNRRYYLSVFNKTMPSQADYALLDVKTHLPQSERYYQVQPLGKLGFDDQPADVASGVSADMGYYSRQSFRADASHGFGPALSIKFSDTKLSAGQYVRASCRVFSDNGAWGNKLVMSVERAGKTIEWNAIRLQNNLSLNRAWNQVYFDAPLPADARPDDVLKVYVLNENGSGCYIDDVQADWMKPKTVW